MKLSCFKCKWLENDINLNTLKKIQTQKHRPTPTVPEEKDKIHSILRNFESLKLKVSNFHNNCLKIALIWQKSCFIAPYIQLNQKRLLWSLVIGHVSLGIRAYGAMQNDLLNWPPDNSFLMPNAQSNLHWISSIYTAHSCSTFFEFYLPCQ